MAAREGKHSLYTLFVVIFHGHKGGSSQQAFTQYLLYTYIRKQYSRGRWSYECI